MKKKNIFEGIEEKEREKLLKNLDIEKVNYLKNSTIMDSSNDNNQIGILLSGIAIVENYDYNGNRFIVETLNNNSLFGKFFSINNGEFSINAKIDCEVLLFNYNNLLIKNKNKVFLNNVFELLIYQIKKNNIRMEILSKRTIKDKLIKYLLIISDGQIKKTITLPLTYTDLADYLCVDRSAMMRELKKMQEDEIIKKNGKKIKLLINDIKSN